MTLALRTSYGPFSAGTRVTLVNLNETAGYALVKLVTKPPEGSQYQKNCKKFGVTINRDGAFFEIEADNLVELRTKEPHKPLPRHDDE